MELTISGTGFIAGGKVTITYDDTVVGTATTDDDGNFSANFTTPPSMAGNHTVTATDGTNTLTFIFTMESDTPSIPVLLLPEMAAIADAETHFDWEDIDDPSGITYILQIGTDTTFSSIVLEKKELIQSEYTLTEEEALKAAGTDAPYYWRIRAIDGASNKGKWTNAVLFFVSPSTQLMPDWTLYLWIGLGALLLGVLGFWIIKRIKK
jgi:hypothetical protein